MSASLVQPALRYAESHITALREGFDFVTQPSAGEEPIREIEADFDAYLARIMDQTGTMSLPTGEIVPKVPFSVLWLVEGEAFIGQANIRHELSAYTRLEGGHIGYGIRPSRRRLGYGRLILKLALDEGRRAGMGRVLVTCADDNLPSARIIEANGGRLEDIIDHPAGRGRIRRYWIAL